MSADIAERARTSDPAAVLAELEARGQRVGTPSGDGEVAWRVWGVGEPVVLLHGAHGSWSHFARNIEPLATWRRVIAVDIPGFGDSAVPPRPTDGDSYAEEIIRGLRMIVGDTPVDLVGFSTGATISAHVAGLAPELVRRLVIVNAGGMETPMGQFSARNSIRGKTGEELRAAHRANLAGMMFHDPAAIDDLALHIQATNAPKGRVSPRDLVLPDRLLIALDKVRAPLDVVWGEFDVAHPDAELHHSIVQRFDPGAELRIVRGVGHWVMYEGGPGFNAALDDLLRRPVRSARA